MATHLLLRRALPLLCVISLTGPVAAQDPGAGRIPASPAEVLGHELGERFTDHAGVVRYMEALAASSPRVRIQRYGQTPEGRPLLQVVIAREDHLARLDEILARNRELADPDTPERRVREIASSNPAVIYFSYGVHGNESSSSEAALWTAWDLVRGAESVAGVLDSAIVVIDPAVNPDGRDRYVNWFRQAMGAKPNPNPEAREHWEPWPGGRFNHYLFDLNRDWAWLSQPETRARMKTWEHWTPQVHVDFHEMNWTSSYFFFPAADPINPIYPDHTLRWGKYIGEANAAAFDAEGWAYYTGQSFDLFYPGYGDSWPSLTGAIGMTYEQAGHSRAGLVIQRPDGTLLTLRDRAEHHRTSGEATLRAVARRKTDLLLSFAEFHRTVGQGEPDILLVPGSEPGRVEALVSLLREQGIKVERATRAFRASTKPHHGFEARREFAAGTYRVPARQSRGRLAATLLRPEVVLDATYSYDVSAWSLPYAYGIEAHSADRVPDAGWQPVGDRVDAPVALVKSAPENGRQPYGYLVAPGFAAWPALVRYLAEGGRARVLDSPFTLDGRSWPAGTIFLPRAHNDGYQEKIEAAGLAGKATAAWTGFTPVGNDLGTQDAYDLELPRIAVLMGDGVAATSYGAHWFFLEQTLGLPFDAVPVDRLGAIRLDEYDVVVFPDMSASALGKKQLEQIDDWVRRGGTIVAVAGGARVVAESIARIEVRKGAEGEEKDLARALRGRSARELENWEDRVPGTILPTILDADHPLAFGAGLEGSRDRLFVLHTGGATFEPNEAFETIAYFPEKLEKVSGVINGRSLERLSQSSWLAMTRVGRGRAILFADDPLFRHFWFATYPLYTNAILVGPRL